MFKRRKRTRDALVDSGITGQITDHTDHMTNKAIVQMLEGDPYFGFGVKAIAKAVKRGDLNEDQAREWMAESLGISLRRFKKKGPSHIDPNLTIQRLAQMMTVIDQAIVDRRRILLATGHPGSLLQFYLRLASYIRSHQETSLLITLDKTWKITESTWIDVVESVLVITDVGSLIHSHDHAPMETVLKQLKNQVDLVVADHGFAGAAINAGIRTIGLHDVDDPAIPIAARLGLDVIPVPMNDNQGNVRTHDALEAILTGR